MSEGETTPQPRAVHYEVEISPTGEPPWLLFSTTTCPVEARSIARGLLDGRGPSHSRIRRVVEARSVEVIEGQSGKEGRAMSLALYSTLTRRKQALKPADPSRVRMYVCGPTVYQRIHVGNTRPLVVFDVLFRLLRHLYGAAHVVYARNITDIEDKIIDQARTNGEPIGTLTERTTAAFLADCEALGCLPPTHQPRATDHIDGMIGLIVALIERGHAYAADGHVLFHVPSMPTYGRLSGRDRDEMVAGARVEVAPYKRDPADFVLWKPSTPEQPGWESPWGRGRPGWHIECSAMSEALLAPLPFDIHGGGLDLIFPHHENEIAQSCCAHGVEAMASIWMHNGFIDMAGEKMSKSLGNIARVDEVLAQVPGEAVRLWIIGSHYRQPLDYSIEALHEARNTMRRWYRALADNGVAKDDPGEIGDDVVAALSDDLNTPAAIAVLHGYATRANKADTAGERQQWARRLKGAGGLLGMLGAEPASFLQGHPSSRIETMIEERRAARLARDYRLADMIRDRLATMGVAIRDGADSETTWEIRDGAGEADGAAAGRAPAAKA